MTKNSLEKDILTYTQDTNQSLAKCVFWFVFYYYYLSVIWSNQIFLASTIYHISIASNFKTSCVYMFLRVITWHPHLSCWQQIWHQFKMRTITQIFNKSFSHWWTLVWKPVKIHAVQYLRKFNSCKIHE